MFGTICKRFKVRYLRQNNKKHTEHYFNSAFVQVSLSVLPVFCFVFLCVIKGLQTQRVFIL